MTVNQIAELCHEVNRAYCESMMDHSQPPWEYAPEWQKASCLKGVEAHIEDPHLTPEGSHELWLNTKRKDGWIWGSAKNPALKTHPCLMPYHFLSPEQRAKDYMFKAVVHTCRYGKEIPA